MGSQTLHCVAMDYERWADEQLAAEVSERMGIEYETALRAVSSDDPDLGRGWAISILRRMASHEEAQARLTEHRRSLRSAV